MIWPVNGPITSPFCEPRAWEACHPGIDIGVADRHADPRRRRRPRRAHRRAAPGGYGNFTCIQHTASLSTCYAHQSRFASSVGAQVSQGQVIGYVGCTGHCFGDAPALRGARSTARSTNPMNYL